MKEKIDGLVEKAKQGPAWLRAGVSAIPWAGGALDHLLFDKAGEIRMQNVEKTLDAMKDKLGSIDESMVSKEWFESEEALDMFKNLLQKIEFEGDKDKIKALSAVYCLFGTNEHKDDPKKFAVLDILSKLTNNQRVIFKVVNEVPQETKTITEDVMQYTATAKWQSTMLNYCNSNFQIRQELKGHVKLDVELEILTAFNLLVNMDVASSKDTAYRVSELGKLAYSYLKEV